MPQYIRKIKGIRHTGAFLATGGKTGKTHNVTAGGNIGDGVFKNKNGDIYQIQGNLIRYYDPGIAKWSEWMLNPKLNDGFNAVGKKKSLTAMEFTGDFPDFYAPKPVWNATGESKKLGFIDLDRFFSTKQQPSWPFTGDTGGVLNWQIGLEDPPYYGLFGSKKKKEAQAVADAMADARRDHPPVNTCADAEAGIRSVRAHIESTQRSIDDGSTGPSVGPRYIAAYNTILAEYTAFYNNSCLLQTQPPVPMPPVPAPAIITQGDPILQTALPSVPSTPSQVAAQQQAAAIQQSGINASGTTTVPASAGTKVPKWALYAGGGLAAITILALILKKKKA